MFFACGSSAPVRVEGEGGTVAWLVGTLAAPIVQGHSCLCPRNCGPIRVFLSLLCSWWSGGLFGQSFSIALPIQALRRLPCLGSFSVVWSQAHRGAPMAGVLLCNSVHQALDGPASVVQLRMLAVWRERGYGDGSIPFT